jgi:hypothetical protein
MLPLLAILAAHPLHTTMTELTVDEARHSVRGIVRVFADDVADPSRADTYVARTLAIASRSSRVALAPCGVRRQGDVLFVCVEGTFGGPARELRMSNALLCDRYSDQVNVVQVTIGRERRSLLFTRGDAAKALQ